MTRSFFLTLLLLLTGCSSQNPIVRVFNNSTLTPEPTKFIFLPTITPIPTARAIGSPIPLPPEGQLYHGVYPGGDETNDVTFQALLDYENAAGKNVTWLHFSTYWYQSRKFPTETALWIRNAGSIPYIRLMLQSDIKFSGNESIYTLQNILDGQFDADFHTWCVGARDFSTHLLVEYGTEINSDSFPWSGIRNGAGKTDGYGDPTFPDGPERFRDAYRHIIQICRDAGAVNITWVFHIDSDSYPDTPWNKFENYYPGDDWIDWIGISIYGVQTPTDIYYKIFRINLEKVQPRIIKLAPDKPIIIAEFGSAKNNPFIDQVKWTSDALTTITSLRYKNLIGFAWWNEAWQNDGDPAHNTTMRVQDNPDLEAVFKKLVGENPMVIGEIAQ